jgi:transporter family-2 protein
MPIVYLLSAIVIGAAFAAQPAINGAAARILGSAFPATALSVAITLLASIIVMILGRTTPSLETMAQLPWWVVMGGLIGLFVVGGGTMIVPVTGAAVFFVCLIAGQLFGSVLLDHIGAFGLPVREIGTLRLLGILLTFGGVILVRYG